MNRHPSSLVATLLSAAISAQGQLQWQPGEQASGPTFFNGATLDSVFWDPDGAGPAGEVIVVAGLFEIPSLGVKNLARFDPTTSLWSPFPAAPDGRVDHVVVTPSGALAIAGSFTTIAGQPARGIAIGDGTSWFTPDGGIAALSQNTITALRALPNGDLLVGGSFTAIGSTTVNALARWDGSQWNGYPGIPGSVTSLALRQNGNVVIGGDFPGKVAEWNGSSWSLLLPTLGGAPSQLLELAGGELVAAGGATGMAVWNGAGWTSLATGGVTFGLFGIDDVQELPNGDLLTSRCNIPMGAGAAFFGVGRWDGTQWSPFAPGFATSMLPLPGGAMWATGSFPSGSQRIARGLGYWDGADWSPTSTGLDNTVRDLTARPDGRVVAIGDFRIAGGYEVTYLAEFTGQAWRPLRAPAFPGHTPLYAKLDYAGELVVAGTGYSWPGHAIFRLTQQGWQQLGSGFGNTTDLLIEGPNRVIASRALYPTQGPSVAIWNGTAWLPFGAGLDGPVHVLLRRRNGELVAGGEFLFSGATSCARIARWNGTTWLPFGAGFDGPVRALVERPDGELIAAGDFQNDGTLVRPLGLVARWDGVDWQAIGGGFAGAPGVSVRDLALLPDGDVLAGGDFTSAGGAPVVGFARFDGNQWSPLDGGIDGAGGAVVETIAVTSDGRVAIGGDFATANGAPSAHFASLQSDMPATAAPYGQGCAATAGPLELTPTSLPWIGGAYRATTTTLANGAIALDVFGFAATQLALTTVLPFAAAGCDLLATTDVLGFAGVVASRADSRLDLPNDPALLQAELRHQVLVLDGLGGALLLASSNAARLTIGGL